MRTIPIAQADNSANVSKQSIALTRRSLLKGTGVLMGTLAIGSPLALLAPSNVWAVELKLLNKDEGDTLLQMGRALFPHEKLPDAAYALLAKDLDAAAAADPKLAAQLRDGIASLNRAAGGSFLQAKGGERLAAVKSLEGSPFFNTVRGKCVTSLYDNEMAFVTFGYPGSAWEKGGYIVRGFQDLQWLPNPPADASPQPYLG
ncbi:twin-arginine translocation signal domain-containing protein [Cupriavidus consociatus]|uniref:twin-arginine translocation signal domain-containing protein n=1 Tax=Cupriavidus consociatus TaxID=2821357 RepID=UPI001AE26CA2|nr:MULTISPECIES: twin-arginine translocation signal domain-containing protein [unclassified Cupriavidus]MBP0621179.1 twin-arginine translocation signal domain-containing protein [Cupriavidus sp. LEh25]MDK2657849.1 twin-arginine translocation signal domain-containing protein [Cupriavidus sp. LEh21]